VLYRQTGKNTPIVDEIDQLWVYRDEQVAGLDELGPEDRTFVPKFQGSRDVHSTHLWNARMKPLIVIKYR